VLLVFLFFPGITEVFFWHCLDIAKVWHEWIALAAARDAKRIEAVLSNSLLHSYTVFGNIWALLLRLLHLKLGTVFWSNGLPSFVQTYHINRVGVFVDANFVFVETYFLTEGVCSLEAGVSPLLHNAGTNCIWAPRQQLRSTMVRVPCCRAAFVFEFSQHICFFRRGHVEEVSTHRCHA